MLACPSRAAIHRVFAASCWLRLQSVADCITIQSHCACFPYFKHALEYVKKTLTLFCCAFEAKIIDMLEEAIFLPWRFHDDFPIFAPWEMRMAFVTNTTRLLHEEYNRMCNPPRRAKRSISQAENQLRRVLACATEISLINPNPEGFKFNETFVQLINECSSRKSVWSVELEVISGESLKKNILTPCAHRQLHLVLWMA